MANGFQGSIIQAFSAVGIR